MSTETGTTAPPFGARSMQRSQTDGFFADGEYPTHFSVPAAGPLKGALHDLQRQGLGKSAKRRRLSRAATAAGWSPRRICPQRRSICSELGGAAMPHLYFGFGFPSIKPRPRKPCGRSVQYGHARHAQETNDDHRGANDTSTFLSEGHGLLEQDEY